jgi:hypothetical protein
MVCPTGTQQFIDEKLQILKAVKKKLIILIKILKEYYNSVSNWYKKKFRLKIVG